MTLGFHGLQMRSRLSASPALLPQLALEHIIMWVRSSPRPLEGTRVHAQVDRFVRVLTSGEVSEFEGGGILSALSEIA